MTAPQRLAIVALIVGLALVGVVDLVDRSGSSVVVAAASPSAAVRAVGQGAAAAAPASSGEPAAPEQDDTGDESSPVASAAPPSVAPSQLPTGSGTGRRIVYTVKGHRVWLVNADNSVVRTMLVTNRIGVPNPGTYKVFGKATKTINKFFPEISMEYMTRFAISPNKKNTIGFHAIPFKHGKPMQTEAQLGAYGSGGCVRMTRANAIFVFNWAAMGTKVVVLP